MAAAGSTGDRLSLGVSGDTRCRYPLASGGHHLIIFQFREDKLTAGSSGIFHQLMLPLGFFLDDFFYWWQYRGGVRQ